MASSIKKCIIGYDTSIFVNSQSANIASNLQKILYHMDFGRTLSPAFFHLAVSKKKKDLTLIRNAL